MTQEIIYQCPRCGKVGSYDDFAGFVLGEPSEHQHCSCGEEGEFGEYDRDAKIEDLRTKIVLSLRPEWMGLPLTLAHIINAGHAEARYVDGGYFALTFPSSGIGRQCAPWSLLDDQGKALTLEDQPEDTLDALLEMEVFAKLSS